MNKIEACLVVSLWAALAQPAMAYTPGRDWPSVVLTPAIDVPMRETAITRGPDDGYYLTGVVGVPRSEWTPPWETSKEWDFHNSRQIKLWKSSDLKSWTEIGVVWDLENRQGTEQIIITELGL